MNAPGLAAWGEVMQRASAALIEMDYLTCEVLCLEALGLTREAQQWTDYARVLMPLQESRRQRRMIALDGSIGLDVETLDAEAGCIAVRGVDRARAIQQQAREARRHIVVLAVEPGDSDWAITSFQGPEVSCTVAAPDAEWVGRCLPPTHFLKQPYGPARWRRPADWFVAASEALGDAAIAQVDAPLGQVERVAALEARLAVVVDHEKLHQRLAEAARHAGRAEA